MTQRSRSMRDMETKFMIASLYVRDGPCRPALYESAGLWVLLSEATPAATKTAAKPCTAAAESTRPWAEHLLARAHRLRPRGAHAPLKIPRRHRRVISPSP